MVAVVISDVDARVGVLITLPSRNYVLAVDRKTIMQKKWVVSRLHSLFRSVVSILSTVVQQA